MVTIRKSAGLCVCLALLLSLVGCGGSGKSVNNASFQPQIVNAVDDFQFQATNVTNISQTVEYTWQNTGIRANITQSGSIAAGATAILIIRDANGTAVYQADLINNGTFTSISGNSGAWKIQVALSGANGTINFRVQRGG